MNLCIWDYLGFLLIAIIGILFILQEIQFKKRKAELMGEDAE